MKKSSSQSTPMRPEGKRTINAPLVELDLQQYIRQIKEETTWETKERNTITVFKSDTLRILLVGLKSGSELKKHKTNAVISVQVLEGEIVFSTTDKSATLQQAQMITLHANIPHKVKANKESFFLLTLANVPKR